MSLFKDETLQHKLVSKGLILVLLSFLIAPAGYIIRAVISNDLSVSEVGVFYSTLGLVSIFLAYSGLGLNESFKYFFPRFWIEGKKQLGKALLMIFFISQILMAFLFALLMRIGSGWLASNYFHFPQAQESIKLFAVFLVIVRSLTVFIYFFETIQDVFWAKFLEFIRMWFTVGGVVYVWKIHQGSLYNYTFWRLVGAIVALVVGIVVFKIKNRRYFEGISYPNFKKLPSMLREVIKYGLYSLVAIQGGLLLGSIDQQIVVYFLGSEAAGYYTTFLSVLFLHTIVTSPLFSFLFPLTSELISKKQLEGLKSLMSLLYKYFILAGIFVGLAYFLLGKVLIYALFGEKFFPSVFLLKIASGFVFVNMLIGINFNILSGLGKVKQRAVIIWWVAFWNIVSDIIFIYLWGLPGVVYSTLVGWLIFLVRTYHIVSKELSRRFEINRKFIAPNIGGLLLRSILVYGFCKNFSCVESSRLDSFVYVVILGGIGIVILGIINIKSLLYLKNLISTFKKGT